MQEPIKSIINEIEENKLEETDKIEEQEEKAQSVGVRSRTEGDVGQMKTQELHLIIIFNCKL